jgi:hypothetical protein
MCRFMLDISHEEVSARRPNEKSWYLRVERNIYLVFESARVPMYTAAPYAILGIDESV